MAEYILAGKFWREKFWCKIKLASGGCAGGGEGAAAGEEHQEEEGPC